MLNSSKEQLLIEKCIYCWLSICLLVHFYVELAAGAGVKFSLDADAEVDVQCSAGSATSLLVATRGERAADLAKLSGLDVFSLDALRIGQKTGDTNILIDLL